MFNHRIIFNNLKNKRFLSYKKMENNNLPPNPSNPNILTILFFSIAITYNNKKK